MGKLKEFIFKMNFFFKVMGGIFTLNIMDDVIYKRDKDVICFINQGNGYPYYDVVSHEKLKDGKPKYVFNHVHKRDIQKIMTLKNIFGSVKRKYESLRCTCKNVL